MRLVMQLVEHAPSQTLEQLLAEAELSVRPMSVEQVNAIVMAMLLLSDDGVLITDLNHRPLACNSRFGQIFRVLPNAVTTMEVEELRGYVYPRLQDPDAWKHQLEQIYAQPELIHEDELALEDADGVVWIRRRTGPLYGTDKSVIGRLWAFKDITKAKLRERRSESLTRISHLFHQDPAVVCRAIVQELSDFYQSAAILSIWEGDMMVFREAIGMPPGFESVRENPVQDAFCQFAMEAPAPVLFQDARKHERACLLPVVGAGITRCLSAPLLSSEGKPIGTLCFIDSKSSQILTDEDVQYVALLAQRISTELEREKYFEERTAAQRAEIDRQARELAITETVFQAINSAFQLLSQGTAPGHLAAHQTSLLHGLLGYRAVALLSVGSDGLSGFATKPNQPRSRPVQVGAEALGVIQPALSGSRNQIHQLDLGQSELAKLLACRFATVARLPMESDRVQVVVFGAKNQADWNPHHEAHVTALIDQVALLLTAHQLQADLQTTLDHLRDTQELLVQSEKLSVVGTLAASVSHDIRNIVASLTLECSLPVQNVDHFRQRVKDQVERFSLLANRLLAYAKPQKFATEPSDVREILVRASDMLSAQAKMWRCEIKHQFDAEVPQVQIDRGRMEHVFVNLMLNAFQALNSSGGVIWLGVKVEKTSLKISVKDNGRGIPEAMLSQLFRPFKSSRSDGFGLGLYSCQQILSDHGWTIDVQSTPDCGTEFIITAPILARK